MSTCYDELLAYFRKGLSLDDAMALLLERYTVREAIAAVTAVGDQEKARLAAGGERYEREEPA